MKYISTAALGDTLENLKERKIVSYAELVSEIAAIPAADVRPVVRGKWIAEQFVDDGGPLHEILSEHDTLVCSVCGYKYLDLFGSRHNFCPNCGARMEES